MAAERYDSSLQMFVQAPRELDMTRVAFMRWLAEQGRLEHRVAGPSSGPLVVPVRTSPEATKRSNLMDKS